MIRCQSGDTIAKTIRCNKYDDEHTSNRQSNDIIGADVAIATKQQEIFTGRELNDSGIVCDSETIETEEPIGRRLGENIDSNEIDSGEECTESPAAIPMDEEYVKLRADLAFCAASDDAKQAMQATSRRIYPPQCDDNIERSCRDQRNVSQSGEFSAHRSTHTICVPIDIDGTSSAETTPTEANVLNAANANAISAESSSSGEPSKSDHNKNDVIFKNIFGATKNAIFRTAQSIIENHEKKHAQKVQSSQCSGGSGGTSSSISNSKSDVDAGRNAPAKSPVEMVHKKDFFTLKGNSTKQKTTSVSSDDTTPESEAAKHIPRSMAALSTFTAMDKKVVPGVVKCFVRSSRENEVPTTISLPKIENGHNGLLRFFESPIFNIHFAIHYLFYSKEPGVLSFIGNKIFSFKDHDVDLYIPQLILMYIQMDDLAEVLDPYLVHRCRKAADFSLKCSWLLEAYNYTVESFSQRSSHKKPHLMLIRELYPKRDRRALHRQQHQQHPVNDDMLTCDTQSPVKKTHHRSQSDATGLLNAPFTLTTTMKLFQTPVRLCLGDLSTGRAFDNGCSCFESVRGTVNDLLGHKTVCTCGASKLAAQREFMKSLVDIGRDLTPLPSKTEKTSILRMRLNLINKNLPARVWLPLNSDMPHHIVRIKEEKTAVLNSKDKTPYIIYVEVVEVNDIYTSPVIAKMMPSLRHTKSEEHLDSTSTAAVTADVATEQNDLAKYRFYWQEQHNGISDDNAWLPEDDEITAQYLNMHKSVVERDTISEMSLDSVDSRDHSKHTRFLSKL